VSIHVLEGVAAGEPPEARGIARDSVRLLRVDPTGAHHGRFTDLPSLLTPGDLIVVNTSRTLPAALDGHWRGGQPVTVHFSTARDDGSWIVELRPAPSADGPVRDAAAYERVELPGDASITLLAPYPDPSATRLWVAEVAAECGVIAHLLRYGRPIHYSYVARSWPIEDYQTVFAKDLGSAEMPSAGRPFTDQLVTDLVTRGVGIAPITLHAGVSSLEGDEGPLPEWFSVPAETARLVGLHRQHGGRIVAVGTTATRALESAADEGGTVHTTKGWTNLVLGPHREARVVDGIITGWHTPGGSHLRLLEAVAGSDLVAMAYREAFANHYRWHEFGDSCLLLRNAKSSPNGNDMGNGRTNGDCDERSDRPDPQAAA
jgi:S-adenosylmethionine:tRNA ribosyltransferase-isomerase